MLHRLRLFAADFGEPIGVWLCVLIAFGILCFTGCGPSPELAQSRSYKALAAATLATEGDAAPTPSPDIAPTGTCKNCKGTGIVGDKTVGVPCPVCGGDGKLDGEAPVSAPSVIFQPAAQPGECACENCQCGKHAVGTRIEYPADDQHGAGTYVAKWVWEPAKTAPQKPPASARKLPPPASDTAEDCSDGQCNTFIPRRGLFRGR